MIVWTLGKLAIRRSPEVTSRKGPPLGAFLCLGATLSHVMCWICLAATRLLVSRAFDGSDDAEAVAKGEDYLLGDAIGDQRSPAIACATRFPGADRIFHRGHNAICENDR